MTKTFKNDAFYHFSWFLTVLMFLGTPKTSPGSWTKHYSVSWFTLTGILVLWENLEPFWDQNTIFDQKWCFGCEK
jgi:hypothetical protein